jgi:hypothetical protein
MCLQVAFLDYVRFLIGSMWGACSPKLFAAKAGDMNQGMHKRSNSLHAAMVRKAASLAASDSLCRQPAVAQV